MVEGLEKAIGVVLLAGSLAVLPTQANSGEILDFFQGGGYKKIEQLKKSLKKRLRKPVRKLRKIIKKAKRVNFDSSSKVYSSELDRLTAEYDLPDTVKQKPRIILPHEKSNNAGNYVCINQGNLDDGVIYALLRDPFIGRNQPEWKALSYQDKVDRGRHEFNIGKELGVLKPDIIIMHCATLSTKVMVRYIVPSKERKLNDVFSSFELTSNFQHILRNLRTNGQYATISEYDAASFFPDQVIPNALSVASVFIRNKTTTPLFTRETIDAIADITKEGISYKKFNMIYAMESAKAVYRIIRKNRGKKIAIVSPFGLAMFALLKYKDKAPSDINPIIYGIDFK